MRVTVLFAYVGTWMVEQCGSVVALCGRGLVRDVTQDMNFVTYFGYMCFDTNQKRIWLRV